MEHGAQRQLLELYKLEKTITEFFDKIDDEISKTNVEWLNLKSIAEAKTAEGSKTQQQETKVDLGNNAQKATENSRTPKELKMEINWDILDEIDLNVLPLELDTKRPTYLQDDEEYDSD